MAGGNRGMDDPRFSKVFSDPRFRSIKRKDLKVKLDDRFNKKALKNEFTLLKSTAKVDKYGRKIEKSDEIVDNLDKYYKDDDEDNEGEEEEEEQEEEEEEKEESDEEEPEQEESESDSESDSNENLEQDPLAKARGLVGSDSDSSDEEVQSEIEDEYESSEESIEQIPELDPTTRIAVVNLDWDHLNSNDLYATFNSFLPKDGYIKNVTIYKSQYGKERLSNEEINGPPKEIFKSSKKSKKGNSNSDSDSDSESESDDEELDLAKASKKLIQENNEEEEEGFNSSELRKYQLQRLRYYYAIVEFNTLESAIEIYSKCDNTEYESSGNFFDLRYVPIDMDFDESDIRDSCKSLPTNYQPIEFATDSLRNSKPKLTWDETPIERVQILSKSFKQGELDDLDLKNYLASDSEDENDIEEQSINKYKQLVGNTTKESNTKSHKNEGEEQDDDDDDDVDIEFTFTPSKTNEVPDGKELSSIEKLREKEKERRKNRKQKVKELKREAQNKGKKNKGNNKNNNQEEPSDLKIEQIGTQTKELDHFNIKDVEKLEKLKSKKNKFKNKRQRELESELEARLGSNNESLEVDSRFSEMIDSHAFAGGSKLLQQERKRRKKEGKNRR
jgi:hypothetical protein